LAIGAYLCNGNQTDTPKRQLRAISEFDQPPQPRTSQGSPAAFSDGAMLLEAPVVSVSRREELPAPIVIPRERHVLARELQRELKRVGCYKGPLNGTWTPSTRGAMAKLIERVNARLPTAEPDAALYALTRAQSLDVCGGCPTGQSFDVQGRRTPAAILSGSRRTSKLSSGRDQRTDPAAWSNLRVTRSDTSSSLAGSVDSSEVAALVRTVFPLR